MQKTPEKVERQILALLKAGMTQKAVREKFGVGNAVIRRIVEENGLLRADRELERHKKLDFPQYLLDDWEQELNYWKGREDGSDWNCCVLRCVGWPVCLVTEPARASEGSGRGPGAGRISYGMEQESWEE